MNADMAIELQGTGVYVLNLHPGPVETEASQELAGDVRNFYKYICCLDKALICQFRINLFFWALFGQIDARFRIY
jgi:NAD(P)-dependent dehydrogenase (short-subunit alcohol dehydrogenase family)